MVRFLVLLLVDKIGGEGGKEMENFNNNAYNETQKTKEKSQFLPRLCLIQEAVSVSQMVSTYSGKGASHREGDEKVLRWGT
jgi:hypothetical protein